MNGLLESRIKSVWRIRSIALTMLLLLCAGHAAGQLPPKVRQQSTMGWQEQVEFDVRLKGVPIYVDGVQVKPSATVKLVTGLRFKSLQTRYFAYTVPCWNKTAPCPKVAFITIQAFVRLPWNAGRVNVTKYMLCDSAECSLPDIIPIQAKPGEGYSFRYDRVKAVWDPVPFVVTFP